MALTREEIIDLIEDELGYLDESDLLNVVNEYNSANSYPIYYKNDMSIIEDLVNDSLSKYIEYLDHSEDTYDKTDDYFYFNGNGWWTSFNDLEDQIDTKAVSEYVYEHFDDYENLFESVVTEIEDAQEDDDDEEE